VLDITIMCDMMFEQFVFEFPRVIFEGPPTHLSTY